MAVSFSLRRVSGTNNCWSNTSVAQLSGLTLDDLHSVKTNVKQSQQPSDYDAALTDVRSVSVSYLDQF